MKRGLTLILCAAEVFVTESLSIVNAGLLLDVHPVPAPRATIRAAYRRKAALFHPDANPEAGAQDQFMRITAAYDLLLRFAQHAPAGYTQRAAGQPRPPPSRSWGTAPSSSYRSPQPAQNAWTSRDSGQTKAKYDAWQSFWSVALAAGHTEKALALKCEEQDSLSREADALGARLEKERRDQSRDEESRDEELSRLLRLRAETQQRRTTAARVVQGLRDRLDRQRQQAQRLQKAAMFQDV